MTLTKADMAEYLLNVTGFVRREAREVVELFFKTIAQSLEEGHQVKLSGFGNFELNDKAERPGRNPKTGEAIPVQARRVVTFHSGQKLRARVEQYGEAQADSEIEETEK